MLEFWNYGLKETSIPTFHHSMWLTKEMAANSAVIPINCINFDTLVVCLSQAINQTVKIVNAVKFDFNFAFLPVFFNHDLGTEVTGEIFGKAGKMYLFGVILGYAGLSLHRFQAPDEGFSFSDRQLFGYDRAPGCKLLGGCLGTQQGSGMSHAQRAIGHAGFDLIR